MSVAVVGVNEDNCLKVVRKIRMLNVEYIPYAADIPKKVTYHDLVIFVLEVTRVTCMDNLIVVQNYNEFSDYCEFIGRKLKASFLLASRIDQLRVADVAERLRRSVAQRDNICDRICKIIASGSDDGYKKLYAYFVTMKAAGLHPPKVALLDAVEHNLQNISAVQFYKFYLVAREYQITVSQAVAMVNCPELRIVKMAADIASGGRKYIAEFMLDPLDMPEIYIPDYLSELMCTDRISTRGLLNAMLASLGRPLIVSHAPCVVEKRAIIPDQGIRMLFALLEFESISGALWYLRGDTPGAAAIRGAVSQSRLTSALMGKATGGDPRSLLEILVSLI